MYIYISPLIYVYFTYKFTIMHKNIPEYYPQHRDKCYCRKPCECNDVQEEFNKTRFIKRKFRLIKEKSSHIDNKIDNGTQFEKLTPGLSYTPQREHYETLSRCKERELEMFNMISHSKCNDDKTKFSYPEYSTQNDDRLYEISEFRNRNASDCISLTNQHSISRSRSISNISSIDHICSHRYILNDRNLPIPESSNSDGHSLCIKCKRPYADDPLKARNCRVTQDDSNIDNIKLKPSEPILILEVHVDKKNNRPTNVCVKNSKLLSSRNGLDLKPSNSLALRYQQHK